MIKPISQSLDRMEVNVQYADSIQTFIDEEIKSLFPENWQDWFQTWLNDLSGDLPKADGYELTLRLTDDREIQQLNAQYRFKDQPTDVLAFAALENNFPTFESADPLYLGDIIISLETAQRQASSHGHSLKEEVAWLTSHGLLHLLGWDHLDQESLEKMLLRQESLLKLLGISCSLR